MSCRYVSVAVCRGGPDVHVDRTGVAARAAAGSPCVGTETVTLTVVHVLIRVLLGSYYASYRA